MPPLFYCPDSTGAGRAGIVPTVPLMIISLLKSSLELLQPLSLLWLGLLAFWFWLRRQQQAKAARHCLILWLFLTASSCLSVGNRVLATLENPWRDIANRWHELPTADAIVCLGGGVEPSRQELIGLNMQENSDRPTTAIELLRQGKAPRLVIGGGGHKGQIAEAEAVKAWIDRWQLTKAEVTSLGVCVDTHDEAVKVAALAKAGNWKRILLVTSASHMKRASAVFIKSTGIEVLPVPCAFQTKLWPSEWVHLPEATEFHDFSNWFHETVGWFVYRRRCWI